MGSVKTGIYSYGSDQVVVKENGIIQLLKSSCDLEFIGWYHVNTSTLEVEVKNDHIIDGKIGINSLQFKYCEGIRTIEIYVESSGNRYAVDHNVFVKNQTVVNTDKFKYLRLLHKKYWIKKEKNWFLAYFPNVDTYCNIITGELNDTDIRMMNQSIPFVKWDQVKDFDKIFFQNILTALKLFSSQGYITLHGTRKSKA